MGEPRKVPFGEIEWADDAPGIRAREVEVGGARWATVEYGEGTRREDGHHGFVLSGGIEYEFDGRRSPSRAAEGEAFLLPPAPVGKGARRVRNLARGATRLFLIDAPLEG